MTGGREIGNRRQRQFSANPLSFLRFSNSGPFGKPAVDSDFRASVADLARSACARRAFDRHDLLSHSGKARSPFACSAPSFIRQTLSRILKDEPADDTAAASDEVPAPKSVSLSGVTTGQIGRIGQLAVILFRNFLFSIVTLFVYRFWARTRMRRYIWGTILINEEPLEYAGTPVELLRGFLITLFVIVFPIAVANFALQLWLTVRGDNFYLLYLPIVMGLVFLIGVGLYSARRYRLSRTQWRGIRFGQTGSALGFGVRFLLYTILTILSLGLCFPLQNVALSRYRIQHTWFGDRKFEFDGSAWTAFWVFVPLYMINIGAIASVFVLAYSINDLVGTASNAAATLNAANARLITTFLILIVSYPLVLLFSLSVYQTVLWRFLFASTSYNGLSFRLKISVLGLMWLKLTNLFIRILTLNFAAPLALLRNSRYALNRLDVEGTIDIDGIAQNRLKRLRAGEGLADVFDLGSI